MYANKTLFIKWMNQSLVTIHDVLQIMFILACHAKSETFIAQDDVPFKDFELKDYEYIRWICYSKIVIYTLPIPNELRYIE